MAIIFPRPFAFAIDDLGWNEGSDMTGLPGGGPYRAGVKRTFDINDYKHIVDVGKAVGARIQSLFILSEMDRDNILAKYPTTTYMRDKWDNSRRVNEHQHEIMNYVRDQAAFMEFGFHGTGHEYWEAGQPQKRAEWYNLIDRRPWPENDLRGHVEAFRIIMAQYGFTKENGHSFPESFVPCAYSYYWNPGGSYSLGKLLVEAGVKYANTDFSQIPESNPPEGENGQDFDHGVHVINRINYGNQWYELDSLPRTPIGQQGSDVIEAHWPNWLAQDDFLQGETTKRWVEYYKSVQRFHDRYIAKNTEQLHSQSLYRKFCVVTETSPGNVTIDNTKMRSEAYERSILGNLVLKIKLDKGEHISWARLNNKSVATYFEDEGFGFVILPPLQREVYSFTYELGSSIMPVCIWNDGTYNVYDVEQSASGLSASIRVYGEQVIKLKCPNVTEVQSHGDVDILSWNFDGEAQIKVKAKDMQGSNTRLIVKF